MFLIAFWIAYFKGWIFADFKSISPKEALQLIKETNITVVDIRSKEEFEKGHIKGAILIPYDELKGSLDRLKEYKDKEIIIYSKTGRVGISASRLLVDNGFKPINVKSGILGLAIEGGKKYPFLFERDVTK
jgi:rhodanese-related sulfurtransferase